MPEITANRGQLKIRKSPISVVIYTQWHRIEGNVHSLPGARFSDFMNANTAQTFMPVTEARVYPLSGNEPLYSPDFLVINRNHITLMLLR